MQDKTFIPPRDSRLSKTSTGDFNQARIKQIRAELNEIEGKIVLYCKKDIAKTIKSGRNTCNIL
jgi:hypothetical protein